MFKARTPAIDQFTRRMYTRTGVDRLGAHLESVYGTRVGRISELDLGVYRVDRHNGSSWVARLFPAARLPEATEGDAEILRALAERDFPAERCAVPDPVSVLDGQALLVTDHVDGVPKASRRELIRSLGGLRTFGEMLGRLHAMPGADRDVVRYGGAWHHLADGGPHEEIAAAAALLADAEDAIQAVERPLYDSLREEVERFDDCDGLPHALIHPDFVLENVVASPDRGLVVIDWTGAGRGPRLWSLAFLLFSQGAQDLRRVDLVVAGYRKQLRPDPEELARLASVIRVRPTVFDVWAFCVGRKELADVVARAAATAELADAIAARAIDAFG